jgi:membrane-bound ClpP family serine protease
MTFVIGIIIALGLLLIFIEIFFIPGTTLFGVVGGVAVAAGVILVYVNYGSKAGNTALIGSLVAVLIAIAAGFKVIQTNKFAMKAELKGRVNEAESEQPKVGDKGIAVTELRPNGKALFGNLKTEVYSNGDYISRDTTLEVVKVVSNKIFVHPLKS